MNEALRKKLLGAGVDPDSALERFMGNEGLYLRFAGRFLEDRNYEELLKAMEKGDTKAAFAAAHTLKGVSGNLSFTACMAGWRLWWSRCAVEIWRLPGSCCLSFREPLKRYGLCWRS